MFCGCFVSFGCTYVCMLLLGCLGWVLFCCCGMWLGVWFGLFLIVDVLVFVGYCLLICGFVGC